MRVQAVLFTSGKIIPKHLFLVQNTSEDDATQCSNPNGLVGITTNHLIHRFRTRIGLFIDAVTGLFKAFQSFKDFGFLFFRKVFGGILDKPFCFLNQLPNILKQFFATTFVSRQIVEISFHLDVCNVSS